MPKLNYLAEQLTLVYRMTAAVEQLQRLLTELEDVRLQAYTLQAKALTDADDTAQDVTWRHLQNQEPQALLHQVIALLQRAPASGGALLRKRHPQRS